MPELSALAPTFGKLVRAVGGETLDALGSDRVMAWFREAGALVFRGFEAQAEVLRSFAARFGRDYVFGVAQYPWDDGAPRRSGRAASAHDAVPLHGAMSHAPRRPDVLWLLCVRPARAAGESTLCDGAHLLARLTDAHVDYFERRRLLYAYTFPLNGELLGVPSPDDRFEYAVAPTKELRQRLEPFYGGPVAENLRRKLKRSVTGSPRTVLARYVTPAIQRTRYGNQHAFVNSVLPFAAGENGAVCVTAEDGSPLPQELIDDVRALADEATLLLPWQRGDLAMIDNTRVLHGRRGFDDPGRKVLGAMSVAAP